MRVIVLGCNARETTLVKKLSESEYISNIYVFPGNSQISSIDKAESVNISYNDFDKIKEFSVTTKIDLIIPSTLDPIKKGIKDYLSDINVHVFSPDMNIAKLEYSKVFGKEFMYKHNIRTPKSIYCENQVDAEEAIKKIDSRLLVKPEKVYISDAIKIFDNEIEAYKYVNEIYNNLYGEEYKSILVEELIDGFEFSLQMFVINNKPYILPFVKDYKRAFDNFTGPNTDGMGSYTIDISEKNREILNNDIINPMINGFNKEGITYNGFLYLTMIWTEEGPSVIEFNVRLGDPELQSSLPLLKNDIGKFFKDFIDGNKPDEFTYYNEYIATLVLANKENYPESSKANIEINELSNNLILYNHKKGEQYIFEDSRIACFSHRFNSFDEARGIYQLIDHKHRRFTYIKTLFCEYKGGINE